MPYIHLLLFGVLAASLDLLSCAWHRARERRAVATGAGLAMVLEALQWAPLWFALRGDDPLIMVASVVGSGVGTAVGLSRWVR